MTANNLFSSIGEPSQFGAASGRFTTRPVITGRHGVVTAGHYLSAAAGLDVLRQGGNAIDAGIAMAACSTVVEPHQNGVGGESPMLIYHAPTQRVVAINGQGVAPRAATIDWFKQQNIRVIPGDGLLPAMVPCQVDNWCTALAQFGTMPLGTVLGSALDLARRGFAVYHGLRERIASSADRYRLQWPGSAAIYLPDGQVPHWGQRLANPQWADTLEKLLEAERANEHRGRISALEAARDVFYKGEIAQQIADFAQNTKVLDATGNEHSGLLSFEDLADFQAQVEQPLQVSYHGLEVHKCQSWSQGPVLLQQLNLLENDDLARLGHNSSDYIHLWVECAKLAFADREFYYGDPAFTDVPMDRLLAKDYAADRRALVDSQQASLELRPGDVAPRPMKLILGEDSIHNGDTTMVTAVDREGNMICVITSGGWMQSSPVIPGLGFPLGTRGQMFSLDPEHPNALQPGKRPRTTLTPSLVTKDGQPWMVFGTPGGDQQDQWPLQFFLNLVHFGMDVQEALDAPNFHTAHFPSSFYPRTQQPGRVVVEEPIGPAVRAELLRRGHDVQVTDAWSNGRVQAIRFDPDRELIFGGASPRGETPYAMGW